MMHQDMSPGNERVSALADGQLRGEAFAETVAAIGDNEEGMATWHAYHLIGDTLRSTELAASHGDAEFLTRLRVRLEAEPTGPVAHAAAQEPGDALPQLVAGKLPVPSAPWQSPAQPGAGRAGANDANMRWKLVAGVASLAAVAAIGWQWMGMGLNGAAPASLAATEVKVAPVAVATAPVPTAAGDAQVMLRDPRLDELVAAHKQFGGTSALQMPAGFLRNATFENPGR